jgi:hypothetical protein
MKREMRKKRGKEDKKVNLEKIVMRKRKRNEEVKRQWGREVQWEREWECGRGGERVENT